VLILVPVFFLLIKRRSMRLVKIPAEQDARGA